MISVLIFGCIWWSSVSEPRWQRDRVQQWTIPNLTTIKSQTVIMASSVGITRLFPKQQNKEQRAPYHGHDVTSYTHSSLLHKGHHHCPVHHWHQFKYEVNHLTSSIVTSGLGNILTLPGYWNVMTFSLPNRVFVQVSTITFSLSPA